ncbi:MAG: Ig-like domain-containing protein, partial [Propionibacteriaceae bacterium]|nr:Ig-like domain-containing protein [Propionibacteriaceae bacterium]
ATVAFTVDTVKPATPSVTSPAPGALLATSTPAFSGTGGEANAAVTVSEGDLDLCTAPVQADGSWTCTPAEHLTQGAHTVTVTQTDLAGNPSDPASVSFSIDSQRPAAPVVLGPANGLVTSQKYPAISGSGEPGATVVVTEGTDTVCTAIVGGDASWSCTPTIALAVGDHTLTVVQHDPAGNESAETTVSFRVVSDTLAAPAITAPTSGAVTNAATQVISGTGQSGSQVSVLDGGETTACTATVQASGTWTCTASLSDGVHTLTATQSAAGQMSPASAPVALRVDTSAPLAPVVTSPADNAVINDPTPSITGTGEAGAQVSVTEGSTVLCAQVAVSAAGTWSCVPGIVLDEGAHTLSVRQTDAAGNDSPVRSASFTIDTTPPQVTVNPTDGLSVSGTAEPGAVVDVYDAAGNVVPGCQHLIADAQGQFGCMPATPLEPGEQVQVSVTDAAGNVTRQGGVAAQMRSLALNPVGNVGAGAKPVFSGTGQPGYQVRVTSGSDTLCTATVAASGTWSCTSDLPLTDGSHTLSAVQTDGAGHSSAPTIAALSVPVTGVTLNPVATVASGGKPALSGTGQPGYQVRVSSGDTALCSATVADDGTWACTSAVPLDSGDYTLTVMQADATGNTSAPAQQQLSIAPAGVDIGTIVNPGGDSPLMHGTGEPGAHIAVTDADGNIMCTATVAADGTWSCQVDGPIAQGATVTATQTAASGQTVTSATVGANGFADNVPAGGTNVPAAPWGALGGLGLMAALGLAVMGFHRRYLAIEVATSADTERKER